MIISEVEKLQPKHKTRWGYDTVVKSILYSDLQSARSGVRGLRRDGWSVDTAYPTLRGAYYLVMAVRKARQDDYQRLTERWQEMISTAPTHLRRR